MRASRETPWISARLAVALLALVGQTQAYAEPVRLPGLRRPVDVRTDERGVPSIEASSDRDLFLTQGYVHARDRFFQMDANRRAASGTLAELTGSFFDLRADAQARLLGFRRAAQRSLDAMRPDELALAQAYADGVNAWLASAPLPPEYAQLEVSAVPAWSVLDSLSLAKAFSGGEDARLYQIADTAVLEDYVRALGEARGSALFHGDVARFSPMLPRATVPDAIGTPSGAARAPQAVPNRAREHGARTPQPGAWLAHAIRRGGLERAGVGSNVWGVAARHSATGRPLVANDGHAALSAPSMVYEIDLRVRHDSRRGPLEASGASFPGILGVNTGKTAHLAWGNTSFYPDVSDVFRDRLLRGDPACGARLCIASEGRLHAVEERMESYRLNQVGDGILDNLADVTSTVRLLAPAAVDLLTVPFRSFGPIVALDDPGLVAAGAAAESGVLTLQYTGLHATREVRGLLGLLRARNVFEAEKSLRSFTTLYANWVIADVDGNLAYFASGEVPLRADLEAGAPAARPPWFVREGSGASNWVADRRPTRRQVLPYRVIPPGEMPRVVNPPAGFVVNCNDDPSGANLDNDPFNQFRPSKPTAIAYHFADFFTLGTRAERVRQLLREKVDAGERLTVADMKRIQADTKALDAELTVPFLVRAFAAAQRHDAAPALAAFAVDPKLTEAVQRLAAWDFTTPTGIPEGYDGSDRDGERDPELSPEEAASSVAATLFAIWRWKLIANHIRAPLAALGLTDSFSLASWTGLHHLLSQEPFTGVGASDVDFFPGPAGLGAADRRDVALLRALRETLDSLASPAYAAVFGGSTDLDDYRWGRLHRITFVHRLGGASSVPPAAGFSDLAPGLPGLAHDGGADTVNAAPHGDGDTPASFLITAGSIRRLVLAPRRDRGVRGWNAIPGGSSGDPANPLYASQLGSWLTVDHQRMAAPGPRGAARRERFVPTACD